MWEVLSKLRLKWSTEEGSSYLRNILNRARPSEWENFAIFSWKAYDSLTSSPGVSRSAFKMAVSQETQSASSPPYWDSFPPPPFAANMLKVTV